MSEGPSKSEPVQQVLRSKHKTLYYVKLSWNILKRVHIPCLILQHLAALKKGNGYSTVLCISTRRGQLFAIFSCVLCQDLFPFMWHQTPLVHMDIPPQTKHFCKTSGVPEHHWKGPWLGAWDATPKSKQSPETGSAEGICNCKQSPTSATDQHCRKGQVSKRCEAMKLSTFIC